MIVRMVHPRHGAMHAYDNGEIERLRGYGWVPEDEASPKEKEVSHVEIIKQVQESAQALVKSAQEQPKRKPGRPKKA